MRLINKKLLKLKNKLNNKLGEQIKRFARRLPIEVVLSTFLHFLVFAILFLDVLKTPPSYKKTEPKIQIELVEKVVETPLAPSIQQIVTQEVQPDLSEKNKKSRFLSASNFKAAKETRSKKTGQFKNTIKEDQLKSVETSEYNTESASESQTDDHLKDVEMGIKTVLSTQQFKYYNYYTKIKEKVKKNWDLLLKTKFTKKYKSSLSVDREIAVATDNTTQVAVTLNNLGEVEQVYVSKSSGNDQADELAILAFRNASPFEAPPKDLVDSQSQIKMRWDLVLETE